MGEDCKLCGLFSTAQYVCLMGQGPTPCDVMIVGEAPAYRKERDKPFQGEAGTILDEVLDYCHINRSEVYITNVVKCRPPENRHPKTYEIAACRQWLKEELATVQPKYVLLLGGAAAQALNKGKLKVGDVRGKFFQSKTRTYFVTLHPGAVLRDPTKMPMLKNDVMRFFQAVKGGHIPEPQELKLTIINSDEQFSEFIAKLSQQDRCAFDIETTGLFPWKPNAHVVSMGFAFADEQYVLPMEHREGFLFKDPQAQIVKGKCIADIFRGIDVITHNGKFDALWVKVCLGMDIHISHDTMLMSHLLDENIPHGLKYLAEAYLGAPNYDLDVSQKTGGAPLSVLARYNALDVFYTRALYNRFITEMKEDPALYKFYKKVIIPAVNAFLDIEYRGVYVDCSKLSETKLYLQAEVARLENELNAYKRGVNWNSTQQVGQFLFKDLGLSVLEYTPKGAFKTSESVLQRLDHPAAKLILDYKESYKMLGSFITSWIEKMVDSRLHPNFKLHGTVTGRLSCEEPNLQQVPRNPKIRSLVTAPEGYTFVEADFSQVELRIAAMLSGDPTMRELFLTGQDIHTKTAQVISGKDMSQMEGFDAKEWRKKAKAINFGFLYGMGAKKFQEYARDKYRVAFSLEESQRIRKTFFDTYSGLQVWYNRQDRTATLNGYVRSPSGRVRHLPGIHSPDDFERSQAVRQAINSPVQGFASDTTLVSVVDIVKQLPSVKVVGTVHDSVLMEIPTAEVDGLLPRIKSIMENPPTFKEMGIEVTLPIKVDISVGNWGSGKKWEPTEPAREPLNTSKSIS